ncbi:PucR family transcriptional regulator [Nocardiopsis ansamitocini]|nr:helix-turn-helix domain-containing protein [Nocardiopsis ansamitocini]
MSDYQLDVWCRTVGQRRVSALLLLGYPAEDVPRTAQRMAARYGFVLACLPLGADESAVLRDLARAVDGGAGEALSRAVRLARLLAEAGKSAESADFDPSRLCELAQEATGIVFVARRPRAGEIGAPVLADGVEVGHVSAVLPGGSGDALAEVGVRLTVEAAMRLIAVRDRADELPVRTRGQVLREILVASGQHLNELVPRARALGLAIDDWHLVLAVETTGRQQSELERVTFAEIVGGAALRSVGRSAGGSGEGSGTGWHLAFAEGTPLLVRTWRRDPGVRAAHQIRTTATAIRAELAERFPDWQVRCGAGSVHEGVEGLRTSWAESRAALLSDMPGHGSVPDPVVLFDDLGLHRMLVEWFATGAARTAVRDILAPLDAQGPAKAATMVRTLRVYLDNQGSISSTATALNLHRNAITYRLKQITALLETDLSDPDHRLAVHLACRAWQYRAEE